MRMAVPLNFSTAELELCRCPASSLLTNSHPHTYPLQKKTMDGVSAAEHAIAKRAGLDQKEEATHSPITGVLEQDGDDEEDSDLYGKADDDDVAVTDAPPHADNTTIYIPEEVKQPPATPMSPSTGIPGLFLLSPTTEQPPSPTLHETAEKLSVNGPAEEDLDVAMGEAEEVVKSVPPAGAKKEAGLITEEYIPIDMGLDDADEMQDSDDDADDDEQPSTDIRTESAEPPKTKAPLDPEFLAQAEANKGDENAEWQFDSSDAESSSDSDSGSDSSEDDEDDKDATHLTPEEIAKLLMKDGEDDGGPTSAEPLRTKNEVLEDEVKVERPDVTVTPDMQTTLLGEVENIVGTMILIRALNVDKQRVLGEGSVLVNEARTVIGAVNDTLGRVESPMYTVRFNSASEMSELGIEIGKKIFYLPSHAEYIFTQPLRDQKGSDASNVHDEEVGDAELEFSDDEAEAEFKRKRKMERYGGGDGDGRKDKFKQGRKNVEMPPATDEPYVPLQRPANLHELAANPPPPPNSFHRGRGGGGRGDNRGGRGGRGGQDHGRNRGRGRGGPGGGGGGGRGRGGHDGGRGRGSPKAQQSSPRQQQLYQTPPQASQPPPPQQAAYNFTGGVPSFGQFPFAFPPPPPPMQFLQQMQQMQQMQQQPNVPQFFPPAPPPQAAPAPQQPTHDTNAAFQRLQSTLNYLKSQQHNQSQNQNQGGG